jgi:branched-chain amino acid transport system substrate-binding protein
MKFWITPLVAALALVMTGVSNAADDLVIGFSTSTTGPYISNSLTNQVAVDIAVNEINAAGGVNGHKLRVVQFDTGGDAKQAVTALQQFTNDDNALGIIGPFASAEVRVAFPAGERAGIPSITNAASTPGITDGMKYGFRNTSDEGTQFRRLVEAMREKKMAIKSAAIIYATDEFVSKSLGEQLYPGVFKAANIPVTISVGFPLAAFDLAPQVAQLKQHPSDVVAIGGTVDAAVKIAKEMRRQGIKSRIVGSGVISDSELAQKLGPDGEGTLYPTYFFPNLNPSTVAFSKKFAAEAAKRNFQKTVPNQNDASAYDVVYVYAEAMKRAKVTGDKSKVAAERTAIRDQLAQMKSWNYKGLLGHTFFGEDGAANMPTYVIIDSHALLQLMAEIDD